MKKYLSIIALAALALVGCQKEQFQGGGSDGVAEVTISATVPQFGAQTKATFDGDGNAAYANRCILEIYWVGDVDVEKGEYRLYKRMEAELSAAQANNTKKADFTIQLPKNREYYFVFWADNATANGDGTFTDKWFDTESLTNVSFISDPQADMAYHYGNNDALDAFYSTGKYTIVDNFKESVTLYRPFAQVNVITTDATSFVDNSGAAYAGLVPETVQMTYKAPVSFNVLADQTGVAETITYDAAPYKWNYTESKVTIAMDYIFASADKEVLDIDFVAKSKAGEETPYAFAAIPVQRNYRTNITGALLTTVAKWNVTVDPMWKESDYEVVHKVCQNIEEANSVLKSGEATSVDILTPDDAETVHLQIPEDGKYSINFVGEVAGKTVTVDKVQNIEDPAGTLGLTAPEGTTFDINLPQMSVTISEGSYKTVTSVTAEHTLIVEKNTSIETLVVNGGSVEIWGTVDAITRGEGAGELTWHVYDIETFGKALTAKAETIVLEADLETEAAIAPEANLALDLNGHSFSAAEALEAEALFTISKNFTVSDSRENGAIEGSLCTAAIATSDNAVVIINGGTLSGKTYAIEGTNTSGAKITVNGGHLGAIYNTQNGSVDIKGGTVTGTDFAVKVVSGAVTVLGGELIANDGKALELAWNGENTIAAQVKGGELTGTYAFYEAQTGGESAETSINISIKGGTFNGEVYSQNETGFIANGRFSQKPATDYIIEGSWAVNRGLYYEIACEPTESEQYAETKGSVWNEKGWATWDGKSSEVIYGNDYPEGTEVWMPYAYSTGMSADSYPYCYGDQGNGGKYPWYPSEMTAPTCDVETIYVGKNISVSSDMMFFFCKKIKEIHFEGGCDMTFGTEMFYGCDELTDIYFDTLPTSLGGSCTKGSTTFIGSNGPKGQVITIHVPAGWINAGYPQHFTPGDNNQSIVVVEDR